MKISNVNSSFLKNLSNKLFSVDLRDKELSNESGAVLVAVLLMSILSMVLAVTVYSLNISQASSSQRQIDRIKAEQLMLGQHWRNYMSLVNSGSPAPDALQTYTEEHGGITTLPKNLTVTVTDQGPGPGVLSTTTGYSVSVNF